MKEEQSSASDNDGVSSYQTNYLVENNYKLCTKYKNSYTGVFVIHSSSVL